MGGNRKNGSGDFEEVALPFVEDVGRFALSLTRDQGETDDLIQETFLRALRGWHTFKPGTNCRRWLFTICRNAFVRRQRRGKGLVLTDEKDLDAMPTVLSHVEAARQGLDDLFDRIEVRPTIERVIGRLPEPHHSILVLVDLEGMPYEEAAQILDVPVGTVRSRLFRARRMIQDALIEHAVDLGIVEESNAESEEPRKEVVG